MNKYYAFQENVVLVGGTPPIFWKVIFTKALFGSKASYFLLVCVFSQICINFCFVSLISGYGGKVTNNKYLQIICLQHLGHFSLLTKGNDVQFSIYLNLN